MNYPGLRKLLEVYGKYGFEVIGFPCNQFGGQAPGTSEEERAYAYRKFGIDTFPIMDKVDVNGKSASPAYQFLRAQQPQSTPATGRGSKTGNVEWNYTKFLVDRDGQAVKRYNPSFDPLDFEVDLRLVLAGAEPIPAECVLHPGRIVCQPEVLGRLEADPTLLGGPGRA